MTREDLDRLIAVLEAIEPLELTAEECRDLCAIEYLLRTYPLPAAEGEREELARRLAGLPWAGPPADHPELGLLDEVLAAVEGALLEAKGDCNRDQLVEELDGLVGLATELHSAGLRAAALLVAPHADFSPRGQVAHELLCVKVHNSALEAAARIACPEPQVEEEVECSEVADRIRGLRREYRSEEVERAFARREELLRQQHRSVEENSELSSLREFISQLPTAQSPEEQDDSDFIRRAAVAMKEHLPVPVSGVSREAVLAVLRAEIEKARSEWDHERAVRMPWTTVDMFAEGVRQSIRALPEAGKDDAWHFLPELPEANRECLVAYRIGDNPWRWIGEWDGEGGEGWLVPEESDPQVYAWKYAPEPPPLPKGKV